MAYSLDQWPNGVYPDEVRAECPECDNRRSDWKDEKRGAKPRRISGETSRQKARRFVADKPKGRETAGSDIVCPIPRYNRFLSNS
jgi:hypothetical protein